MKWPFRINRCPHVCIRGIYGDEIRASGWMRLQCSDCGRLLDGPVSLSASTQSATQQIKTGEISTIVQTIHTTCVMQQYLKEYKWTD